MTMFANVHGAPTLDEQLHKSLQFLENHFLARYQFIEEWFAKEWQRTVPPVYGSVDLRNAGFKLAPVDMNLFPAGFNNLNPAFLSLSVAAAKKMIECLAAGTKRILLIPETHTRNTFYWESTSVLQTILQQAGFEVRLGTLNKDMESTQEIALASGAKIKIEPLLRENDKLVLNDFLPDTILLNNDLSEGIPDILHNLKQPLIPPAELGWSHRLKSEHFHYYANVAEEFAQQVGIDPWQIAPLFKQCGEIDFMQQEGLACLISNAEKLFAEVEAKYKHYNIQQQPFLIVKADAGTYGMAVMTVRHVDELRSLNRKQRTRMATIKGGQPVRRVIIQEGVYTFETVGAEQAVAEPVVYLFGCCVVGGFYRVHKDRGRDENLNTPGMQFEPLPFPQQCDQPCNAYLKEADAGQNRYYLYGIIARLSMLAAAREIKDQAKK